jgi:hypothetical protein
VVGWIRPAAGERDPFRLESGLAEPGAGLVAGDPASGAEHPMRVDEARMVRRQAGDQARRVAAVRRGRAQLAVRGPLAAGDQAAGEEDAVREVSRRRADCAP